MVALDYNEYRFFVPVINKSISSCLKNKRLITDHFVHVHDMVSICSKARRKGLKYRQDILDNMGSEELAANLFRITQADSKLKRDNVNNEYEANLTYYEIGKKVRDTIKDLGGTMPENLPKPKSSIKEIDKK